MKILLKNFGTYSMAKAGFNKLTLAGVQKFQTKFDKYLYTFYKYGLHVMWYSLTFVTCCKIMQFQMKELIENLIILKHLR